MEDKYLLTVYMVSALLVAQIGWFVPWLISKISSNKGDKDNEQS